jgi:hypothetical protein
MVYGAISGATLNIQKSKGLFAGRWRKRTDRPLGFKWNEQGGKHLGIYLGNTKNWQQQNWNQLDIKIRAILHQWEKSTTSHFVSWKKTNTQSTNRSQIDAHTNHTPSHHHIP